MRKKATALVVVTALFIATCLTTQASAIFNCFTPTPFNKFRPTVGFPGAAGFPPQTPGAVGGMFVASANERWLPKTAAQLQQPLSSTAPHQLQAGYDTQALVAQQYAQQHQLPMHPLKNLFQPKPWKQSLFGGSKMGMWPAWKLGGFRGGSNMFGAGYYPAAPGYPLPDSMNISPMVVPSNLAPQPDLPAGSSYGHATPASSMLDAWSSFYTPSGGFGGYFGGNSHENLVAPNKSPYAASQQQQQQQQQPQTQQGTKTPQQSQLPNSYSGNTPSANNKLPPPPSPSQQVTKNSLAAYYAGSIPTTPALDRSSLYNNQLQHKPGYEYPDWYSGTIDGPSQVFANLKHNLKQQQLLLATAAAATALVKRRGSSAAAAASSILSSPLRSTTSVSGEPLFDGFGYVESINNRVARLKCDFQQDFDHSDRPLWVKFVGSYNTTLQSNPPFNCQSKSSCRTVEIDANKDYRFHIENDSNSSTLNIREPRIDDYGIYRCSAMLSNVRQNLVQIAYQIVDFKLDSSFAAAKSS